MPILIDEVGRRYGKLIVLKRAGTEKKCATWLCRCDCGNMKVTRGTYLRRGTTKSCGCLGKLPVGEAAFNSLLRKMIRDAKCRGYNWALSKEVVRYLTSQPCSYCGVKPNQPASRGHPDLNGEYYYNGLDRIDNARGYSEDNVTPCCGICNVAKHTMTQAKFLEWIRRVYEYRGNKLPDETSSGHRIKSRTCGHTGLDFCQIQFGTI